MSRQSLMHCEGDDDNPYKDGHIKKSVGGDSSMVVTPSGGTVPRQPMKGGRKLFVVTDKMKEAARRKLKELQEAELKKRCDPSTSLATSSTNDISSRPVPTSFSFTPPSEKTISDKTMEVLTASNKVEKTIIPNKERRCPPGNFKTVPVRVSASEKSILTTDEVSSHSHKRPVSFQLCSNEQSHRMGSSIVGFSTAGGRQILVSENAIEAAKAKLLTDDLVNEADVGNVMASFSTARGKKIEVSAEALEVAKAKIWTDELSEEPSKSKILAGFSTAGGKKLDVSTEALEAAKIRFFTEELDKAPEAGGITAGFSTARGKKIEVSTKALEAARAKLFSEELDEVPDNRENTAGFSTAGEKKIQVSKESLEAAKVKLLSDDVEKDPGAENIMAGFSTAGGKKIQVSKEALEAAKTKFLTDELDKSPGTEQLRSGFSKARGKKEAVSKDALKEATSKLSTETYGTDNTMAGFTTAKGKKLDISDDAIEAARAKYLEEEHNDISKTAVVQAGFSTASGRRIIVSDEALESAMKNFGEADPDAMQISPARLTSTPRSSTNKTATPSQTAVEEDNTLRFKQQNKTFVVNEERDSNLNKDEACEPQDICDIVPSEIDESTRLLLQDIENSGDEFEWTSSGDADQKKNLAFPLASIKNCSDLIPSLKVVVVRVYPVMYCGSGKDGKHYFMTEKAFEKFQKLKLAKEEELRERLLPELETQARNRFIKKEKIKTKELTPRALRRMTGEDLLHIMNNVDDDSQTVNSIMGQLNVAIKHDLERARAEQIENIQRAVSDGISEKMKTTLASEKAPTRVLKIRVMDVTSFNNQDASTTGLVTIWNPQEELISTISECEVYEIQALKPAAFHIGQEIRLGSTKTTRISPMDEIFRRELSVIGDVLADGFKPVYDEFDTVGVVMKVEEFKESLGQIVHLVEDNGLILKIKFWSAIAEWGLQDVLKSGNIVACMNLQWRMTSTENKCAFAQETSVFLTNPKVEHLMSAYQRLSCAKEKVYEFISEEMPLNNIQSVHDSIKRGNR